MCVFVCHSSAVRSQSVCACRLSTSEKLIIYIIYANLERARTIVYAWATDDADVRMGDGVVCALLRVWSPFTSSVANKLSRVCSPSVVYGDVVLRCCDARAQNACVSLVDVPLRPACVRGAHGFFFSVFLKWVYFASTHRRQCLWFKCGCRLICACLGVCECACVVCVRECVCDDGMSILCMANICVADKVSGV